MVIDFLQFMVSICRKDEAKFPQVTIAEVDSEMFCRALVRPEALPGIVTNYVTIDAPDSTSRLS